MSYKKYLIMKAVGRVASAYGNTWARKAGDKALQTLSRMAMNRGYVPKTYDVQTLQEELQEMYRQGRFSQQEWQRVTSLLRQAWENRKKPH